MSAPDSSRCVAKLCRRVCGVTFFFIPTFAEEDLFLESQENKIVLNLNLL